MSLKSMWVLRFSNLYWDLISWWKSKIKEPWSLPRAPDIYIPHLGLYFPYFGMSNKDPKLLVWVNEPPLALFTVVHTTPHSLHPFPAQTKYPSIIWGSPFSWCSVLTEPSAAGSSVTSNPSVSLYPLLTTFPVKSLAPFPQLPALNSKDSCLIECHSRPHRAPGRF